MILLLMGQVPDWVQSVSRRESGSSVLRIVLGSAPWWGLRLGWLLLVAACQQIFLTCTRAYLFICTLL